MPWSCGFEHLVLSVEDGQDTAQPMGMYWRCNVHQHEGDTPSEGKKGCSSLFHSSNCCVQTLLLEDKRPCWSVGGSRKSAGMSPPIGYFVLIVHQFEGDMQTRCFVGLLVFDTVLE